MVLQVALCVALHFALCTLLFAATPIVRVTRAVLCSNRIGFMVLLKRS